MHINNFFEVNQILKKHGIKNCSIFWTANQSLFWPFTKKMNQNVVYHIICLKRRWLCTNKYLRPSKWERKIETACKQKNKTLKFWNHNNLGSLNYFNSKFKSSVWSNKDIKLPSFEGSDLVLSRELSCKTRLTILTNTSIALWGLTNKKL